MTTMSRSLRALLSLVTLFGGHFTNRRLDRVVLIAALLVVWYVGAFVLWPMVLSLQSMPASPFPVGVPSALIPFWGIAVLSSWLTWRDALSIQESRFSGLIFVSGGVISIAGLGSVGLAVLVQTWTVGSSTPATVETVGTGVSSEARYFHASTYFGGSYPQQSPPPVPPSGDKIFRGRITIDGRPVVGAGVNVALNSKYKTDTITTDKAGGFELHLPTGEWVANAIQIDGWVNLPAGRSLLLFSGQEPVLGEDRYELFPFHDGEGLPIKFVRESSETGIELELRDALRLDWPEDGRRTAANAVQASDAVIGWSPVKGAAIYEIQLSRVERKGNSASFYPVVHRRIADARLPIAGLSVADTPGKNNEYTVLLYAFNSENKLLTSSSAFVGDHAFLLSDAAINDERIERSVAAAMPPDEATENSERLAAAERLIDDGMLNEAETVLRLVKGAFPVGRLAALKGYLAAQRNDCVAASKFFEEA